MYTLEIYIINPYDITTNTIHVDNLALANEAYLNPMRYATPDNDFDDYYLAIIKCGDVEIDRTLYENINRSGVWVKK